MNKQSEPFSADIQAIRDCVAKDWAQYLERQKPLGEPWKPNMTEQQKKEHDEYVKKHNCPF